MDRESRKRTGRDEVVVLLGVPMLLPFPLMEERRCTVCGRDGRHSKGCPVPKIRDEQRLATLTAE